MFGEIILGLLLWTFGAFYIRFAYREPPKAIDHFFRIPAVFIFFPEHNRQRLGRLTAGALLILAGVVIVGRQLVHVVLGLLG